MASRSNFPPPRDDHGRWMGEALELARDAAARGDIPVGAVVVVDGEIVGRGANRTEAWQDPTAHAEIVALREAARKLGSWRLLGATLYVTLEPCAMCAGAIVLGRLERLVYGADDPKAGMCGSLANLVDDARLNHRVEVARGVRAEEAGGLLREFFQTRRSGTGRRSRAGKAGGPSSETTAAGSQQAPQEEHRHEKGQEVDPTARLEQEAQEPEDEEDQQARPEHGP